MPKNRKQPLTLQPQSLAWLATKASEQQFNRVLQLLDRGQILAIVEYVRAIADPDAFAEFETANLPPDILAARRKAEAEAKQREEDEKRTIRQDGLPVVTAQTILKGPQWRSLGEPPEQEVQEQAQKRRDAVELVSIPEGEF